MDRYAVSQGVLRSGDLGIDAVWASGAGAAAIGLDGGALAAIGTNAAVGELAENGLRCSTIYGALDPVLDQAVSPDSTDQAESAISACADVDAFGLLVTTGGLGERSIGDADLACREWFEKTAPIAARAGVLLLLEPVHPLLRHVSYVHSLRHAVELTAGLGGTGVVADLGHLWWDRALRDDITDLAPHIAMVQIADVDADELALYNYRRTQLGDGVIPLRELVAMLESAGYAGIYENESIAKVPRDTREEFVRVGGERLAGWLASG